MIKRIALAAAVSFLSGCMQNKSGNIEKASENVKYAHAYEVINSELERCREEFNANSGGGLLEMNMSKFLDIALTLLRENIPLLKPLKEITFADKKHPSESVADESLKSCLQEVNSVHKEIFSDYIGDAILANVMKTCNIKLDFPDLRYVYNGSDYGNNGINGDGEVPVQNFPKIFEIDGEYEEIKADEKITIKEKDDKINTYERSGKKYRKISGNYRLEMLKHKGGIEKQKDGNDKFDKERNDSRSDFDVGKWLSKEGEPQHVFFRAVVTMENCKLLPRIHKVLLVARPLGGQEWYTTGRTLTVPEISNEAINGKGEKIILEYPDVSVALGANKIPLSDGENAFDIKNHLDSIRNPTIPRSEYIYGLHEFRVVVVNSLNKQNMSGVDVVGNDNIGKILNSSQIAPFGQSWAYVFENLICKGKDCYGNGQGRPKSEGKKGNEKRTKN